MKPGRKTTGTYIYCITEGEPINAEEGLHPFRPVYSLAYEDLLAVVSRVPLAEFGGKALPAHLEDASWLEREVRAHERVIEKVMEGRTVLPMKFCTIFRSEKRVQALLENRQEEFRRGLARLRDKEEWEVKMYFQPVSPAAGTSAGKAGAGLSGKEYLLKKKAEDLAGWEMMNEANRQAQRSFEKLVGLVEEIQLKPVAAHNSPAAAKLILDAVCLLSRPGFKVFCEELEGLGNELAAKGFRFQLTGPWPPYHFASQEQENVGLS